MTNTNNYEEAKQLLEHLEYHAEDAAFIADCGGAEEYAKIAAAAFNNFYSLSTAAA